ncbi:hypothetical protein SAMN06297387_12860 [Streptomyces zhaozhouensis]|uniref:Uncharacterized protein n=1 Tax=Streptomyces zhaozhouensis TaxID=1300267 RepID=A0A286E860_9ACTN|nr:RRQRL motif-containing zinc-binding protein [Streptomyces zhaozhouensis]SOD67092.1 hypothetical protein SAMN06297387_12860 [Streptomyces zhaozhouensis]
MADFSTFPTYEWGEAPEGLVTRRQLREMDLSPGGHGPVAQLRCRRCLYYPLRDCTRKALLYRTDVARPKRVPTLAQELALDRAMAARQTCPLCHRRYTYCLPLARLGSCVPCHDGTPADPTTYTTPADGPHDQALAA